MKLFKLHVPEELVQMGMSLYQTIFALFMILGPIIGTFVYQNFGIQASIGVMGVAFLCSAAILLLLPADYKLVETKGETSLIREMKDGFRYVWKSKILTLLGGSFLAAGLAIGLTQPLGVFIITERLGLPKEQLQWLMAAFGIGMILGGILTMGVSKKVLPQVLLIVGMAASAIGFVLMGLSTMLWLTLAAQFFAGLFMPSIQIGINSMILQNTEEAYIGRVNGILNPLFMGAMVVTMTLSGWLKANLSIVLIYEIAALLLVIGLVILFPLIKLPYMKQDAKEEI